MEGLNPDKLKAFLMQANMPHATGAAKTTKETDGSRTIEYAEGDLKMHDNFFGGEPYGGRLVIFHKNEPVFLEVYYGRVYDTSKSADEVYGFLRRALQHPNEDYPYRGPAEYTEGQLTYRCSCEGDITNHTVKEYIYESDTEIYSAVVIGGLVDQNARGAM
jgi:hypothetical protein